MSYPAEGVSKKEISFDQEAQQQQQIIQHTL
jgi:hypothetical protein